MAKKTLNDLTPEIRAKIPEYKEKCIRDLYNGTEHNNWKRKDTVEYIEKVYSLAKQSQKPVVIIADTPTQYKIFYNLLFNEKLNKKYTKLVNIIHAVKNKQKKSTQEKLHSELGSELGSELRSELDSELVSELRSELASELGSELGSELASELDSELDSELGSELGSELRSELDSELDSELASELRSELYSELRSELGSELYSELRSELDSELGSELYSELDSELHSELASELGIELDSELGSELDSELYSDKLKNAISAKYHWLFLNSEYTRVYLMWYYFIHKELKLPLTKNSENLKWLYEKVNSSQVARSFYCKKVVLVLKMPSAIIRNEIGFHNIDGQAIQYANESMYYLNGRKMPKWVFEDYKSGTLTFAKFNTETNEDIRAGIITFIKEKEGNEGLMKFLQAKCIDEQIVVHEGGYTETLKLYRTDKKFPELQNRKGQYNQPYQWIEMKCPSTGQIYLIDTCPTFNNVVDCAKWHRPKIVPIELPYCWESAN